MFLFPFDEEDDAEHLYVREPKDLLLLLYAFWERKGMEDFLYHLLDSKQNNSFQSLFFTTA